MSDALIDTSPTRRPGLLFAPALAMLALTSLAAAHWGPQRYLDVLSAEPAAEKVLSEGGIDALSYTAALAALLVGVWCAAAAGLAFVRKRWALGVVRKGFLVVYLAVGFYGATVFQGTALLQSHEIEFGGIAAEAMDVFYWRIEWCWPAAALALVAAFFHLQSWRASVVAAYTGVEQDQPAAGDRVLENIRTHGRQKEYRKSAIWSVALHFFFIVILPWLLGLWSGGVEDYRVPKGSGQPVVMLMNIVKPKPKKKKKLILNKNSAIDFNRPELDEQMQEQVEKETMERVQYKAGEATASGKMGQGGGKTGGWPDGMENSKVRFIRLEYDGPDWNDGMDARQGADINFLAEFRRRTGFKTATSGESHPIRLLKDYTKGMAPPFVYMTGSGGIRTSREDVKVLRDYLLDGGMLFADCGFPHWHHSFINFMRQVLPEYSLVRISDDDPLFQQPYTLQGGAPPLWHHGGSEALGIKHNGRWIVFYHPGDINDAWKHGGSGMDAGKVEAAYQNGMNIIHYAFTQYLAQTRKYRK